MLKTSSTKSIIPKKGRVEIGSNDKDEHNSRTELNDRGGVGDGEVDSNKVEDNKVAEEKNHQKTRNTFKFKNMVKSLDFFTLKARLPFTKLR